MHAGEDNEEVKTKTPDRVGSISVKCFRAACLCIKCNCRMFPVKQHVVALTVGNFNQKSTLKKKFSRKLCPSDRACKLFGALPGT